ncbi:hypothetical protein BVG19_g3427 [[Candida] boidinii]|nr:hypothetical protein BVG19_g3427 [[Candida] boidinii]
MNFSKFLLLITNIISFLNCHQITSLENYGNHENHESSDNSQLVLEITKEIKNLDKKLKFDLDITNDCMINEFIKIKQEICFYNHENDQDDDDPNEYYQMNKKKIDISKKNFTIKLLLCIYNNNKINQNNKPNSLICHFNLETEDEIYQCINYLSQDTKYWLSYLKFFVIIENYCYDLKYNEIDFKLEYFKNLEKFNNILRNFNELNENFEVKLTDLNNLFSSNINNLNLKINNNLNEFQNSINNEFKFNLNRFKINLKNFFENQLLNDKQSEDSKYYFQDLVYKLIYKIVYYLLKLIVLPILLLVLIWFSFSFKLILIILWFLIGLLIGDFIFGKN